MNSLIFQKSIQLLWTVATSQPEKVKQEIENDINSNYGEIIHY